MQRDVFPTALEVIPTLRRQLPQQTSNPKTLNPNARRKNDRNRQENERDENSVQQISSIFIDFC
jgi:hypothetical protein